MGCGTVADYGHLPALKQSTDFTLSAVFDPDQGRCEAARRKFNVPRAFTDQEAFLNSDIEAVTITSLAPYHVENALAAARHGKHILCEKPLAMTEEEGRRMIDTAAEAKVHLFTGFDYRFSSAAIAIRRAIANGDIGDVRSMRLIYIWSCHGKYLPTSDGKLVTAPRRDNRMAEGGPLVDCGVHQIDLARFWLQSEVSEWHAAAAWVDEYEAPDHVYLHMDHENGAHTMVEISYSYAHTAVAPVSLFTYDIIGTRGLIRYDRNAKLLELRNDKGTQLLPWAPEKNFAGMYDAFAKACRTGESGYLATGLDGLIALSISRSAVETAIAERRT